MIINFHWLEFCLKSFYELQMSLIVLYECACVNLISKVIFNLLVRTDLFICLHIMFQISFQSSKGQKSYRKFLGVRSELLLSIHTNVNFEDQVKIAKRMSHSI